MRCPYCHADRDRVVDSRAAESGAAVRRRRQCAACGQRFSTYERVEQVAQTVRKRDGRVEAFQREKVAAGIEKAVKNLGVEGEDVRRAVARVEARVRTLGRREIDAEVIGAAVLDALQDIDHVAYVRFASVYKGFTSPEDFAREAQALTGRERRDPPGT